MPRLSDTDVRSLLAFVHEAALEEGPDPLPRPLLQQLFVLGAGVGVNLVLAIVAWGSLFGALNLALVIGNLIPLYQLDGWKSGMVVIRKLFGRPSPLVEWILTLGGGAIALAVLIRAFMNV